eukprot:scaffold1090_cov265-Pinguiococcus_pyrenoidosus.AAC.13
MLGAIQVLGDLDDKLWSDSRLRLPLANRDRENSGTSDPLDNFHDFGAEVHREEILRVEEAHAGREDAKMLHEGVPKAAGQLSLLRAIPRLRSSVRPVRGDLLRALLHSGLEERGDHFFLAPVALPIRREEVACVCAASAVHHLDAPALELGRVDSLRFHKRFQFRPRGRLATRRPVAPRSPKETPFPLPASPTRLPAAAQSESPVLNRKPAKPSAAATFLSKRGVDPGVVPNQQSEDGFHIYKFEFKLSKSPTL